MNSIVSTDQFFAVF